MSEFYGKDSIRGEKAGVFLHYTDFIYGVAGNEEQSLPYLEMDSKEQLDRMAGWFRDMGLRLVMTEEVLRQEKYKGSLRYIGYLLLGEKKLKLYEVLDVCPALERRMKLNTDDLFQKALQLFYQHDFYLARGNFSEVLKENATDEMAKWYLFTCEKYLDRPYTEGDVCCLNV